MQNVLRGWTVLLFNIYVTSKFDNWDAMLFWKLCNKELLLKTVWGTYLWIDVECGVRGRSRAGRGAVVQRALVARTQDLLLCRSVRAKRGHAKLHPATHQPHRVFSKYSTSITTVANQTSHFHHFFVKNPVHITFWKLSCFSFYSLNVSGVILTQKYHHWFYN